MAARRRARTLPAGPGALILEGALFRPFPNPQAEMADPITSLVSFFRELAHRRVVHAVVVYAGVAFLVLEGVGNLSDALHFSDVVDFAVAIAVIAGFPVAVILAWMYERTPQGVRRASSSSGPGSSHRLAAWGLALLVAAAAGGVVWVAARSFRAPAPAAELAGEPEERRPVLAVLPSAAAADGPGSNGLGSALEAQVEAALSESPSFSIRWRTGLKPLLDEGVPVDSLARRLGIDYFVSTEVAETDSRPSVVVHLVDARSMEVIRSGTVRESSEGTLGMLDAMTRRIEEILRPALGQHIRLREWRAGTQDSVAFHLRWRAHVRKETGVSLPGPAAVRELLAADSLLREALARDSSWLEVHLARADVAGELALALRRQGEVEPVARALDEGIACAELVLRQRPDDPDALAHRGRLLWRKADFDLLAPDETPAAVDRAEADLRRALDRNPNHAGAAAALSELLYIERERYEEALHFGERAYRLDAYRDDPTQIIDRFALAAFELGDDATALEWCRRGLQRDPDNPVHHACILTVLAHGGTIPDAEAARTHYQAVVEGAAHGGRGVEPFHRFLLAAALARAGELDAARTALAEARRSADRAIGEGSLLWLEAGARFRLGDAPGARALMERLREKAPDQAAYHARRRVLRDYVERPEDAVPLPG